MGLPLRMPAVCSAPPLPPRRSGARLKSGRPVMLTSLDEKTLLDRARDGDNASFEELVRRHHASTYRLAYRMTGSEADADDVVQEAFLSAWRGIGRFRGTALFSSWMYRIVVNRCANVTRRRMPTVEIEAAAAAQAAPEQYSPERQAEGAAALAALRRALQQLTVGQRACWILRELHQLSYPEIAEVLNVSPATVRGRLARARADLAEAMRAWR